MLPDCILHRAIRSAPKTHDVDLCNVEKWTAVFGYVRASTTLQEHSCDIQEAAIRRYATEHLHLRVRFVFRDDGISGAQDETKRPGLARLLHHLRPGYVVIVSEVSRLARSIPIAVRLMDQITKAQCRFIELRTGLDTLQPGSATFLTMNASWAQTEREHLRQRVKNGMAHAKSKGLVYHRPPYGYKVDKTTHTFVKDPEIWPVVERILEMRRSSMSYAAIAEGLEYMSDLGPPKAPGGAKRWQSGTIRVICQREMGADVARECGRAKTEAPQDEELDECDEEPEKEETSQAADANTEALDEKPLAVLRAMVFQRSLSLGLSDKECRSLTKEDCVSLLKYTACT
eukprot:ANDGO_01334.mRNA.1 Serine recombinase gin